MEMSVIGQSWYLELTAADGAVLPFVSMRDSVVDCLSAGVHHRVSSDGMAAPGGVFPMIPRQGGVLKLTLHATFDKAPLTLPK